MVSHNGNGNSHVDLKAPYVTFGKETHFGGMLPKVSIELDKPRTLLANMKAVMKWEAMTGKNFMVDGVDIQNFEELKAALWVMMQHEDPDLTLEALDSMIGPANYTYLLFKMLEAVGKSVPEPKEEEAEEEVPGNGVARQKAGKTG